MVPREDLSNICLVSRKFLAVACAPELWRELTINKEMIGKKNASEEFLSLTRYQGTHSLNLHGDMLAMHTSNRLRSNECEKTEERLKNLLTICKAHESIKCVKITHFDLKNVEILDLIEVLNRLEAIDLTRSCMTEAQLVNVFESVPETLKSLNLSGIILSAIPAEYFTKVGESLQHLNFSHTLLKKEQAKNLLQGIAKEKKMKSLKMADLKFSLEEIESDLLASCISRHTESVDLSNTKLSSEVLGTLITRLVQQPHSISCLCLKNIHLSSFRCRSGLLAMALSVIPKLELSGCFYTRNREEIAANNDIIKMILQVIKVKRIVKSIDMSFNNMSIIDPNLLVEAFSGMKIIDISQTSLSEDQIKTLLTSLSQSKILEELKLIGIDISHIETSVLGSLVTNLKYLNLTITKMQPGQSVEIITRSKKFYLVSNS